MLLKTLYSLFVRDKRNRQENAVRKILEELFGDNLLVVKSFPRQNIYKVLLKRAVSSNDWNKKKIKGLIIKELEDPPANFANYQLCFSNGFSQVAEFHPALKPTNSHFKYNQTFERTFKLVNKSAFDYKLAAVEAMTLTDSNVKKVFNCNLVVNNQHKRGKNQRQKFSSGDSVNLNLRFKGTNQAGVYYCILKFILIENNRQIHFGEYFAIDVSERGEEISILSQQNQDNDKFIPKKPVWDGKRRYCIAPVLDNDFQPDFVTRLGEYPVPIEIRKKIATGQTPNFIPWKTKENYANFYHNLLYFEEAQSDLNYAQYALSNREITRYFLSYEHGKDTIYSLPANTYCAIEVPGLSEGRPCLTPKDEVYIWMSNDNNNLSDKEKTTEYMGIIQMINRDNIIALFSKSIEQVKLKKVNIRFVTSRLKYRKMHQAIDEIVNSECWNIILPQYHLGSSLNLYNSKNINNQLDGIAFDQNQLKCIESIVNFKHAPIPFILKGSFGTGKTASLFKSLKLIFSTQKNSRILLCTRSNSALDDYLSKFDDWVSKEQIDPTLIYFLKSFHAKPFHLMTKQVRNYKKFTTYNENLQKHEYPSLDFLKSKRIVLSTCESASLLTALGLQRGHFTHIFIDEAAQITEPESLIPLSIASPGTSVILAGDPEQIGPRIHTSSAEHHGLGVSLLERLLKSCSDLYSSPSTMCDLLMNYRISKSLISLPSQIAYSNRLVAKREIPPLIARFRNKSQVIFHSVVGENDCRDEDSPSFYNLKEIDKIAEIIACLFVDIPSLNPADIVVIAPFYKQTIFIRNRLKESWNNIKVVSPEAIQGLEFKIVILSVSRSEFRYFKHDLIFDLGFHHRKRLITSITRCSSMLIVVGNPHTFCTHSDCYLLMKFAKEKGEYHGHFPSPNEQKKLVEEKDEIVKNTQLDYDYSEEYKTTLGENLDRFPERSNNITNDDQSNDDNNNTNDYINDDDDDDFTLHRRDGNDGEDGSEIDSGDVKGDNNRSANNHVDNGQVFLANQLNAPVSRVTAQFHPTLNNTQLNGGNYSNNHNQFFNNQSNIIIDNGNIYNEIVPFLLTKATKRLLHPSLSLFITKNAPLQIKFCGTTEPMVWQVKIQYSPYCFSDYFTFEGMHCFIFKFNDQFELISIAVDAQTITITNSRSSLLTFTYSTRIPNPIINID